jgi:hypothetical protein
MIAFRHTDARYPFLWEGGNQPAGRWHGEGEGPVHYFADTPHGAWAEFLRHEEITDAEDLETIHRQIWAVQIGDQPAVSVTLPTEVLTGGLETYRRCQEESRRLRARGASRLIAPSAALMAGGARGTVVNRGARPAPPRDGRVIVVFGPPREMVGWIVANSARPPNELLGRVRHFPRGGVRSRLL